MPVNHPDFDPGILGYANGVHNDYVRCATFSILRVANQKIPGIHISDGQLWAGSRLRAADGERPLLEPEADNLRGGGGRVAFTPRDRAQHVVRFNSILIRF